LVRSASGAFWIPAEVPRKRYFGNGPAPARSSTSECPAGRGFRCNARSATARRRDRRRVRRHASERRRFLKRVDADRTCGSSVFRIFACDRRTFLPLTASFISWFKNSAREQAAELTSAEDGALDIELRPHFSQADDLSSVPERQQSCRLGNVYAAEDSIVARCR